MWPRVRWPIRSFLDDVTVKQLEKALGVRVRILPQNGGELLKALLK